MEGKEIKVATYSNAEEVELLLNGTSLGRKKMPANSHLEWQVKYAPGRLEARAYAGGKQVAADTVETKGDATKLDLVGSVPRLLADGTSLDIITVRALDAQGRAVPVADNLVSFTLDGPGKIIGVGNGDPSSHEADKYVESVSAVHIFDWKTIAANSDAAAPKQPPTLTTPHGRRPQTPAGMRSASSPKKASFVAALFCTVSRSACRSSWSCAASERRSRSI